MKTLKVTLLLAVAILMTSCSQPSYLTYYKYDESTARYMNPAMLPGYITPTIADLEVSKTKISETETYKNTLTSRDMNSAENSPTIEYLKNYTVSQAVKKSASLKSDPDIVLTFRSLLPQADASLS